MVYMDMFNRGNIFSRRLYPPYTSIAGEIGIDIISASIRNKLRRLRRLVIETYETVHDLYIGYRNADIEIIASMIGKIAYLAEEMEDLIDEILAERLPPGRNSEMLKHYLNRIKYEVIMNIENDTGILLHYINHGHEYGIDYYKFERELVKFLNGTERALKEIENSLNILLRSI